MNSERLHSDMAAEQPFHRGPLHNVHIMEPRNRFQGMNSAGRYDNPIPTWFLAPIDYLKIPALYAQSASIPCVYFIIFVYSLHIKCE